MVTNFNSPDYLTGQLLVAMPAMGDPRFSRSVIYMCVHNEEGAMGLIINKIADALSFQELLIQLDIKKLGGAPQIPIHFGGPVDTGRGFVLHSSEYNRDGTIKVAEGDKRDLPPWRTGMAKGVTMGHRTSDSDDVHAKRANCEALVSINKKQ